MDLIGKRSLRDLVVERAQRVPDHPCLVVERADGECESFTYREFQTAIQTVAAGLQGLGVRKGDTVVLQLRNGAEFVLSWLALAWIGAVAVPANTANTATEMHYVFDLSKARGLISTPDVLARLRASDRAAHLSWWITDRDGDDATCDLRSWLEAGPVMPAPGDEVGPDDVAQLILTSGTTSQPKAVMLTHGNYLYAGERESRTMMLDSSDRLLTALPLFHVNAQSTAILAALTVGGTAIVLEQYSASRFWQQVRDHRATGLSLVAMQLRTLLAQARTPEDNQHQVRRVLYAINVSTSEKEHFERRFGVEICNGYGLSEAMTVVTAAPVFGEKRWPSIGLPAVGREVRIVDAEGADVPPGSVGEIIVRGTPGRTIMKGYFDDPAATAKAIRGEWLHTDDNGYLDDKGYVFFVDRSKDIIKRAGENISSSEVERVLAEHPAILEVAVVGVPDAVRDEAVKAFVVLQTGHSVTPDELSSHCALSLANFKIPTEYEFLSELPKTSIGKIEKKVLRGHMVAS